MSAGEYEISVTTHNKVIIVCIYFPTKLPATSGESAGPRQIISQERSRVDVDLQASLFPPSAYLAQLHLNSGEHPGERVDKELQRPTMLLPNCT